MEKILVFDICSMCILIVLFASIKLHKMIKGKVNNLYILLVVIVFFSAFLNVWRVSITRYAAHTIINQNLFKIICTIFLLLRSITMDVLILYIYALSGKWYRFKTSPKHYLSWLVLTLSGIIIVITGSFSNLVFSISQDLVYSSGPLIKVLYLISIINYFYFAILLWAYGKVLNFQKCLQLHSILWISLIGVIIQFFIPAANVELITTSIPLLFIFLFIQRPVENIDDASNCLNYFAFLDELHKSEKLKENLTIILIKITNDKFMEKHFPEYIVQKLLSIISSIIYKARTSHETELYYLNSFMFAVTTYSKDFSKIKEFADRCCLSLKKGIIIEDEFIRPKFKMCIINYPKDIPNSSDLISFTNTFTDCIVSQNCVTTFEDESHSQNFLIKYELNDIINKAILEKKFEIYYQPIFNISTKKFESAEALIRLKDDKYGFIPPSIFIPAAELSGAIHSIGEFVITDVFRFISENNVTKYGLKYIELNLSISQCIEINLVSKITNWMNDYGITPDLINLELTESADNFDKEIFMKNIQHLSELNIELSLDDFGTGYSNIERILNLPVKIIKFDKSFADEYKNEKMAIIIEETIKMLHKINRKVLIEGIEDKAALDTFVNYNVDYVQGYYFSKPLPENDFLRFLAQQNGGQNESY